MKTSHIIAVFCKKNTNEIKNMQKSHFLHQLQEHFVPKTLNITAYSKAKKWKNLSLKEKEILSVELIKEANIKLLKNDLDGFDLFDTAIELSPENENFWFEKAQALFTFGIQKNEEKAFLRASKSLKESLNLSPSFFDAWHLWGKVLFALGEETQEYHYYCEAKEKFQQALSFSKEKEKSSLAKIYWDYGMNWLRISDHTGEACEVRLAIQALRTAFAHKIKVSPSFWHDFGCAHMQMALLINDKRIFLQAIDFFKKAVTIKPGFFDAWFSLAECYSQIFINTMEEQFFLEANKGFSKCIELSPSNSDIWLQWASLLGEVGKLEKNIKKLKLSVEKCVQAYKLTPTNPLIIGQWVESLSLLGAYTGRLAFIVEAENKIKEVTEKFYEIPQLWYSYGICLTSFSYYYKDLDYEDLAIEKFQTGLSINRSCAELWHALASAHYRIGNEIEDLIFLERAAKFYKKAMGLKPSYPPLIFDYGKTLLKIGEITNQKEPLENAAFLFETVLSTQKNAILNHPEWLFHYAITLDLLGDSFDEGESFYQKAIDIFHHILLIEPDYPKIHYHLALAYSHLAEITSQKELFKKSHHSFHLAIKQDKEDESSYLEWGLSLICLAQEENDKKIFLEAEKKLLQAGMLGNLDVYYHLACLYSLTGKFSAAIDLLKKAEKLDILPTIEEVLDDEWLENLRCTEGFSSFLYRLENQQNSIEEN